MPRPPPASGLTDHLGFWLRMVSNQVSQAFATKIEARGVTVAEWVLLRALYTSAPQSPSKLATVMGMTKGAVTKLADRLIAKSLLLRRPDPDDARAQTLALTPAGERLVPALAAIADENDRTFFGALTAAERKALEKTLRRLAGQHGKPPFPTS